MIPSLRGENRTVENYFVVGFFFTKRSEIIRRIIVKLARGSRRIRRKEVVVDRNEYRN